MAYFVDIHSHIAWGIDDGIPNQKDALQALKEAKKDGICAIVSTPHFVPGQLDQDIFNDIHKRQKELIALSQNSVHIPIYTGAEVMMNDEFIDELDNGLFQTINNTAYMLVEYDVRKDIHEIPWHDETVYELTIRKYMPVIAHVERYFHHGLDFDIIDSWKKENYIFQINRTSIMGFHGKQIQKNAKSLIEKGYAHVVATDTHRCKGHRIECLSDAYKIVENWVGTENAQLLFYTNPLHIIHGETVESMKRYKKKWKLFRS